MNCVIYGRVSSSSQDNQRAIEELIEYAKYLKFNVLGVYEEVVTGTSKASERPQFSRMMDFVDTNEIQHILVWEVSRLGRRFADIANTIEYFSERKVNIHFKKEGFCTLNDRGDKDRNATMILSLMSAFAETERQTIVERSRSGIRANVARGGSGTGIIKPFGYRAIDKNLVIDEEEAEVVRYIFRLYLDGNGCSRIAKTLNSKNIKTKYNRIFTAKAINLPFAPKKGEEFKWVDGTIYSILTNTLYKGLRRHKGETFPVPSIIPIDDFDRVQQILKGKYNKKGVNKKYQNPLKEKIICSMCGRTYFLHKRESKSDNAYKCLSKRYNTNCGNVSIDYDKLNNALLVFIDFFIKKDLFEQKNNIINDFKNKYNILYDDFVVFEDELAKLMKEKKKLTDVFIKDYIDENEFIERNQNLEDKIKKTEKNIHSSQIELENLKENIRNLENDENLVRLKNANDIKSFEDKLNYAKSVNGIHETVVDDANLKEYYERAVSRYLRRVVISEISRTGYIGSIFRNKQDRLVLLQVHTILPQPYNIIISQRSKQIVTLDGNKLWSFDIESLKRLLTREDYNPFRVRHESIKGYHIDNHEKDITISTIPYRLIL